MSAAAQYVNRYLAGEVLVSAANTNRDGTGTLATLVTAATATNGGQGALVSRLRASAIGTTTAGMLRFYRHNGTSAFLLFEVPVSAITPSGTVRAWSIDQSTSPAYTPNDDGSISVSITLPPGYSLRVSTHNAESFHVSAEYGEMN